MAATSVLRISQAATIGLHAMAMLAGRPGGRLSAGEIAKALKVSVAHLSKVMGRLARSRLVRSARGAGGGFELARDPRRISLLQVYEAVEGPYRPSECLMDPPVCGGRKCLLGRLVGSVNRQVRQQLAGTRLDQLAEVFEPR